HFRAPRQRHGFLGEAARGVGGGPEAADAARGIGESRDDRMPAVEDDGSVGPLAAPGAAAAIATPVTLVVGVVAAPRVRFGVPLAFAHARFCHARMALAIRS